ncbi:MAG TPA: class I SAM-dependent methyltransferase, partial [Opitutaceae bacterium]
EKSAERACWCGHPVLEPYSGDYRVCKACGTLVSLAPQVADLYSKEYWTERQTAHHGLPDILGRARLDLPERCTRWLAHLLGLRLPPARVLEIGCAHGGYVALLGWAGFEATGTELSPWVARFAHETFGVTVLAGQIEDQDLREESFDVIVLNDVIEHLPDPVRTLGHCARLLAPGGFFVIQTPEYIEHLSHGDLLRTNDLFLKHMDRKSEEHLYLYSRRSAGMFFSRLGFPCVEFANPVFPYDMFFAASRSPLKPVGEAEAVAAVAGKPEGRLVQALLDKARESDDRGWAIRRLEAQAKPPGAGS